MAASLIGHTDVVRLLLDRGAAIDKADKVSPCCLADDEHMHLIDQALFLPVAHNSCLAGCVCVAAASIKG